MDSPSSLPADWAWLVPGWFLAHICYQSPVYQILYDEVVFRAAVSTHCVEHVPQRTVTSVRVKRHIPDRHLGIDSFGLQAAGVSSTPGPPGQLGEALRMSGDVSTGGRSPVTLLGGAPSTGGGDEALVQDSEVCRPLTDC